MVALQEQPPFWALAIILLLAQAPLLMGKSNRQRHSRQAAQKAPPLECVADYCLPHDYNPLELPTSERQDIQINLEVIFLLAERAKRAEPHLIFA